MSFDEETFNYRDLLMRFKEFETSHPMIYKTWESYIKIKKNNTKKLFEQGDKALEMLKTINIGDISTEQMLLLFIMGTI